MPSVEPAGTALFLKRWLRRPFATGAVMPSGRLLTKAMALTTRAAIAGRPGYVVELGAGTGEITKALLRAVARLRKELSAEIPKQPRGRPGRAQKARSRTIARQKQRVADLFENRHLFVRHELTAEQQRASRHLTRGLPQLRVLREIMDEVYRLFDRRCKMSTALARLEKLRRRVRRLKRLGRTLDKLKSPNLEKALVFLDDRLLPSTSNAVERGNRRFRKAQKGIYSVRTRKHLEERLALDLQRERRTQPRAQTLKTLHRARAESG